MDIWRNPLNRIHSPSQRRRRHPQARPMLEAERSLLSWLPQGAVLLATGGFTATLIVAWAHPHLDRLVDAMPLDNSAPPSLAQPHQAQMASPDGDRPSGLPEMLSALVHPFHRDSAPVVSVSEQMAVDYFLDIAFGSEFGDGSPRLKKWVGPVRIQVQGSPTPEDWATLEAILGDLRAIAPALSIEITPEAGNLTLYFVPPAQFSTYEPNYKTGNLGFFWANWDHHDVIHRATVLISSEGVSQIERSHLLREELTQVLGLMQDSQQYPDSIFYSPWSQTTHYSALDAAVIALLYSPQLQPGMTAHAALDALRAHASANP